MESMLARMILTPAKRVVQAECSFRILAYGKTDFLRRGWIRYWFKIPGRSGGKAAAGGLRNFPKPAGAPRPQLQAAAKRPEYHLLPGACTHAPGANRMASPLARI